MEPHRKLEVEFGRWIGWENTVACSSGTSALHLAMESLRLPTNSEMICPNLTMIACPRAATLAGLTPVFADCRPDDLLMDLDDVDRICAERAGKVKAVMAVHVYGRRVDMDGLHELARKYQLRVVEDLAEAHGIKPHPCTDAACWSFYRNKVIAGEEGGAVAFGDNPPGMAFIRSDHARSLRSLGFTERHDFFHRPRGHNYRLANCLAAMVLESLANVSLSLLARRKRETDYNLFCPDEWKMPPREVPWVYDLRIPGMTHEVQDRVVTALKEAGVEARHCFKPMTAQEEYRPQTNGGKNRKGRTMWEEPVTPRYPTNADRASREVIYLPLTPDPMVDGLELASRAFETIKGVLAQLDG
jgi:perosamine synthetase